MKLAFVTTYDASDINAWSGTSNRILRSLEDAGFDVIQIGNVKEGYIPKFISFLKKIVYFTKKLP